MARYLAKIEHIKEKKKKGKIKIKVNEMQDQSQELRVKMCQVKSSQVKSSWQCANVSINIGKKTK